MLTGVDPSLDLTPRQRAAVDFRDGNVLVEAVPGSGKTRVIVARCAALLAAGAAASEILVLTFSRRAVGELRARLADAAIGDALPEVRTFHGFAARLLADAGSAGQSRRLLSEPAERVVFERVALTTALPSLPPGIGRSEHFRAAAALRVDEIRRAAPAALARLTARATPRLRDLIALGEAQSRLRERLGLADYDDLVKRAAELGGRPGSAVGAVLTARYRHVLVDEFQDTDPLQLALLARFRAEIFAVGDAAQAIYGFRGAVRGALERARTDLSMTPFLLDESFRCPANVCELARSVWPLPPALQSGVAEPGEIAFRRAAAPHDEAAFIAERVAAAIAAGTPEREIAVLVRSAEPLARLIESALRARGIATARHGGDEILDDPAVDAIGAALRAFAQPADVEHWIGALGHPVLGIAPLALRLEIDAAQPRSVEAACTLAERLETRARVSGARLADALRAAYERWSAGDLVDAARTFAARADVLGFVIAGSDGDARRSGRHIETFLDALDDVCGVRARLGLDPSPAAAFTAFTGSTRAWRADAQVIAGEPGVRILTVHAAKGLEFRFVAIADAVDDRFPQPARVDALVSADELAIARTCGVDLGTRTDEQLAEERSLWYVAVTRSKRDVLVTWSETGIDGSPQRASRFIPVAARSAEIARPSFRAGLDFAAAPALAAPQPPSAAFTPRPLKTTALETWLACRRKFYYGALLRIGSDARGLRPKLGTLVHRAIARFHAVQRDFSAVEPGARAGWTATLRRLAREITAADSTFAPFDSPLEADAALRVADRLLERYARELERAARDVPGGFEVIACEERVRYEVEGVALAGSIDRIDRNPDGSLTLIDVKTGALKSDNHMVKAFPKLRKALDDGDLWVKARSGNPQLALYRHAQPKTTAVAFLYLEARPKHGEFEDGARLDRLATAADTAAFDAIDSVLAQTFFTPWRAGTLTSFEPTRVARTCRFCEFVTVCPGYLEDDEP